ncbi:MAG: 3-dehydroquinate synthase [Archaeoglobi archaeon]|nr:3-dehydroquinate synthase II [Candidatus Mnemosynella bozhongmuii]MDK2781913.1 3-dehydroquinate synthase [Archaeoglobi archaeon]
MRELWLKADEERGWEEKKEKITSALESGFDALIVRPDEVENARKLGKVRIVCEDSSANPDILLISPDEKVEGWKGEIATMIKIRSPEDQLLAERVARKVDYLIVSTHDWKVIPIENLIAALQESGGKLIAFVRDEKEAELMVQILEKGVDGILLDTYSRELMQKVAGVVKRRGKKIELREAEITEIKQIGLGDRVCIDTCTLMSTGEGMLIGSQSDAFFLVHSESEESSYVEARPFRVNAGAVHSYILVGERTRYLSELRAGDEVMIVSSNGETRSSWVGRVKIESRPMILIRARCDDREFSIILQNAETIKLVDPNGSPVPVTELKKGDKVLVHLTEGGRHFGRKIEERIIEK